MSKWFMSLFFAVIASNFLYAQQNDLEIKGTGSNLFVEHVVVARESFFSIGRMYNLSPKDLAAYNHLKLVNGLKVGQDLKIPLNQQNFTQTGLLSPGEVPVPVYHTVEPGETLYRLGVNYNKVDLASIKKWNHLTSDALSKGQPVIVGYLRVDKKLSSLASRKVSEATASVPVKVQKLVETQPDAMADTKQNVPAPDPGKTENTVSNDQKEEPKITMTSVKTKSNINFAGGYFRVLYGRQAENKTAAEKGGEAGVFKSTSGWQDGKYYCFNNDAAPGTVVMVTDIVTGKIIYAKVLDAIPDIKQNQGLSVVISNAAAEELGAGETRFDCMVSYLK
jgi:LysM repeat protein